MVKYVTDSNLVFPFTVTAMHFNHKKSEQKITYTHSPHSLTLVLIFCRYCNMYDCLLIPPRMNVNLFKNTASQLFRH
jgi:hypothetical protein